MKLTAPSPRLVFYIGVLGLLVAAGVTTLVVFRPAAREPRRQFWPGALGVEPGGAPPAPGARAFRTRAFSGIERVDDGGWARENGLGPALGFSHNLAQIFPVELAGSSPQFFPLVAERREVPPKGSGYWNPDLARVDVAEWTAEAARRHFAQAPGDLSFAIGVNDGLLFGESPETLAHVSPPRWFRGRPDYSNLIFTFANRAAAALATTHPDKFLGALAYYWCEQTPDFSVHPQVIPFLTADRSQGYDRAFRAEERALQTKWAAAGPRRLGLYDYVYGQGFLVPRIHPHLLAENLREARRLGFTDYYAEISPNWGIDGPMPWVLAQLLQDPAGSVDALLDEYYTRFFQEAAAPLRAFFERCEAQWLAQSGASYWLKHFRNESQATLFPSAVCGELRGLLTQAENRAQSDRVRARVHMVAEAFKVSERFVALQEKKVTLSRWLALPSRRAAAGVAGLVAYLDARREFELTAAAVTRAEPLAFAPINYDDFLRNNPTFSVAVALGNDDLTTLSAGPLAARAEREIAEARDHLRAAAIGSGVEQLLDGSLESPARPAKVIAGLPFGIGLPEGWNSQVEPTETHLAELRVTAARSGQRGLRLEGAVNTTMFRWLPAKGGALYTAAVSARGRVTASNAVTLTLGWLDAQQRPLDTVRVARLPDGTWPEWQTLLQGGRAPAQAVWVGVGIRLQNQMPGDWAEFDDFSLIEVAASP